MYAIYLLMYFSDQSFPCQILMEVKRILFVNYALGVEMFFFKFRSSVHFSMIKSLEYHSSIIKLKKASSTN